MNKKYRVIAHKKNLFNLKREKHFTSMIAAICFAYELLDKEYPKATIYHDNESWEFDGATIA